MPGGGAAPWRAGGGRVLVPGSAGWLTTAAGGCVVRPSPTTSHTAIAAAGTSRTSSSRPSRGRRRPRRILPPCSGLFIRWISERAHDPEAEQCQDREREDHAGADPLDEDERDREAADHEDDGADRHEGEGPAAQYTGMREWRSYAASYLEANSLIASIPNAKPPMWAHTATPPPPRG